jgi:hypothetical protein
VGQGRRDCPPSPPPPLPLFGCLARTRNEQARHGHQLVALVVHLQQLQEAVQVSDLHTHAYACVCAHDMPPRPQPSPATTVNDETLRHSPRLAGWWAPGGTPPPSRRSNPPTRGVAAHVEGRGAVYGPSPSHGAPFRPARASLSGQTSMYVAPGRYWWPRPSTALMRASTASVGAPTSRSSLEADICERGSRSHDSQPPSLHGPCPHLEPMSRSCQGGRGRSKLHGSRGAAVGRDARGGGGRHEHQTVAPPLTSDMAAESAAWPRRLGRAIRSHGRLPPSRLSGNRRRVLGAVKRMRVAARVLMRTARFSIPLPVARCKRAKRAAQRALALWLGIKGAAWRAAVVFDARTCVPRAGGRPCAASRCAVWSILGVLAFAVGGRPAGTL